MRLFPALSLSGLLLWALVACDDSTTGQSGSGGSAGQASGGQASGGKTGSSGSGPVAGSSSNPTGGSPSAGSGSGASSGSGGSKPSCNGITGTYDMIRTRDKTNPGSCPPTLQVNPKIPGKVTADSKEPSGFRVEIGYSDIKTPTEFNFGTCTNNVAGCSIFATCSPDGASDQIQLTIDGNAISGTIERFDQDDNCSVNFVLTGTRK
jgi:hypothetical protein